MAMTLKPQPNHPNGNVQKIQVWRKHVMFGKIWRFYVLFSLIAITFRFMNSCHKVVRSIRNTTLKLCSDCAKQFVRNAYNCEKTIRGFCFMLTHQRSHWCLCMSFWPKTKSKSFLHHRIHRTWFRWLFLFPKMKILMKGKRFAMIEEV